MPPFLLLGVALLLPFAACLVYFVLAAGSGWAATLYALTKLAMATLPLIGARLRSRPVRPPLTRRRAAALGAALGVVMAGVILVAAWGLFADVARGAAPAIAAKLRDFGITSPARYLAMAAMLSLVHSAFEEWYWRWFVWRGLRARVAPTSAHLIAGLGFALHHAVVAAMYVGVAGGIALAAVVAVAGICWSVLYERTGRLVAPWLAHIACDIALMVIGWPALAAVG